MACRQFSPLSRDRVKQSSLGETNVLRGFFEGPALSRFHSIYIQQFSSVECLYKTLSSFPAESQ